MKQTTEEFLKKFHKKNPSCTSPSSLLGKTTDGRNSYECVAETLLVSDRSKPARVLDLACGDGILLQILNNSGFKHLDLTGVDMSEGELAVARTRLAGTSIKLFEARAQQLPVTDNSMDFIFCHYALMLMGEVEQVLTEIRRCLKPGGVFSAVLAGSFIRSQIMVDFSEMLSEILKSEGAERIRLGDARIQSSTEVKPLLEQYFENVEVKEFEILYEGQPEQLMDFFMLTYQVDLLSEAGKETLRQRLFEKLKAQSSQGKVRFPFNLRQITAVKSLN